jgi:hypothetical protein
MADTNQKGGITGDGKKPLFKVLHTMIGITNPRTSESFRAGETIYEGELIGHYSVPLSQTDIDKLVENKAIEPVS